MRKIIIKNKKLFNIILSFIFILLTMYGLFTVKIEAPMIEPGLTLKYKNGQGLVNSTKTKYVIVSRSVVMPKDITNKSKGILLTIDDGPTPRTIEIMGILKKHNANAIFFVNGIHDKENIGVIEQINREGFSVGNHTWSHLNLKKEKDIKIIEEEINKNIKLINDLTGSNPRFFRAPYGESNPLIRQLIKDDGMIFMDWSGAALDWDKSTKEKDIFVSNVMNNIHNGSIILIHEHPWSVSNLDALLTEIETKGYTYIDPRDIIE